MKTPLLALLHREWRNARTMTLVFVALVPVAAWAFAASTGEIVGLCEVVTLIYGVVLASDLVAAERDDRLAALALLPAGFGRVWAAKALFLAGATTVFSIWAHVVVAVFAAIPGVSRIGAPVLDHATGPAVHVHFAVLAAAALCLLFSTLVTRGIVALFLTLLGGGVVYGVGWVLQHHCGVPGLGQVLELTWPWIVGAAVWGSGSALAFARGGLHLGRVGRPWVLALAPAVVVLGLPAAAVAYAGIAAADFEVTAEGVQVVTSHVSADGRWVAVHCAREAGDLGTRSATWIVDIESGTARRVPVRDGGIYGWSREGTLVVSRNDGPGKELLWDVDPTAREFVPQTWSRSPVRTSEAWGTWRTEELDTAPDRPRRWRLTVTWRFGGEGLQEIVESPAPRAMCRGERLWYWRDARQVVMRDLITGGETPILVTDEEVAPKSAGLFVRDHVLFVETQATHYTIHRETGAALIPPQRDARDVGPVGDHPPVQWFRVYQGAGSRLPEGVLMQADTHAVLRPKGTLWNAYPLDAERMVVRRENHTGVDLCDADGNVIRALFEVGGGK